MLADPAVDSAPCARTREASSTEPAGAGRDRNNATGRFLPGNRAWESRCPAGPAPKFADGETLWKACEAYFEWVHDDPLLDMQLVTYKGRATQVPVHKVRAMTKAGLCRYLNIARTTWNAWHDRPGLAEAVERAESVIWCWQFDGAAAGLLDAGLVIRQLGIGRKAKQAPTRVGGDFASPHARARARAGGRDPGAGR